MELQQINEEFHVSQPLLTGISRQPPLLTGFEKLLIVALNDSAEAFVNRSSKIYDGRTMV